MLLILKKIGEIIGIILILLFVAFFGIGSAISMFLDKNKEDSDDSEIEDKLFNNQNLLKQPVVRNGKTQATVGLNPKTWETWS